MDQSNACADPAPNNRWQAAALLFLSGILLCLGLYIVANYLRAMAWAVVLAIALGPLYERARRRAPRWLAGELLPIAFTVLTGLVFVLPFILLAIEAVRETHQVLDYWRRFEQSGVPAPSFVAHLPFAPNIAAWWNAHLAHAGWASDLIRQLNTSSAREVGRTVGANLLRRIIVFAISMLALFFLFRDGEAVVAQFLVASNKLFGPRGERVALQMAASVHGTVNGLVLVGIGEGVLLGVVYFLVKLPHPILFGAMTAVAAMIPFAAALAILIASLTLAVNGALIAAVIVLLAGFLVTFTADHFVRPSLIGGATKLPFIWVLLGILGGVESFQLLGLFIGPAVMAALILLWRELATPARTSESIAATAAPLGLE